MLDVCENDQMNEIDCLGLLGFCFLDRTSTVFQFSVYDIKVGRIAVCSLHVYS